MSEERPDLTKIACKIIWRLNILCDRSEMSSGELRDLYGRIRDALETDDRSAQWTLMDDINNYLGKNSEIHEEIRNVFHLFGLYVRIQDDVNDA